jgi:ParB-like chromosome segregation protein Spo0J
VDDIRLDPVTIASYGTREQQKRVEEMAKDLKERGQLEPIIVNRDLTIIWRGHTRYFAAERLKWPSIEAIVMNAEEWSAYATWEGV